MKPQYYTTTQHIMSAAWVVHLQNSAVFAAVGAGIGLVVGLARSYVSTSANVSTHQISPSLSGEKSISSDSTQGGLDLNRYKYLAMDPVAVEAANRFMAYSSQGKIEYMSILNNLDKLISMQVTINSGKIEAHLPYRATQCVTSIERDLAQIRHRLRNVSAPHFDVDEASIKQIANDYLFNISKETDEYLLSRRGDPTTAVSPTAAIPTTTKVA
jgi:hypothetical protein